MYRAVHIQLGVSRAIKVMDSQLVEREIFQARFIQEARTAARLNHPNIVQVMDFGVEDEIPYIVMEFVPSKTLGDVMSARRALDPDAAARLATEIGSALSLAHEKGVIHRDVKPANILLRKADGAALLTDFGVARISAEPGLTASGMSVGTYAYMAPEVCAGLTHETDRRSDVYSFAAVLFETATGRPPYGYGLSAVGGHMHSQIPTASELNQLLPGVVDAALARGLAKSREDRFDSASDLAKAFTAGMRMMAATAPAAGVGASSVVGADEEDARSQEPEPAIEPAAPLEPWAREATVPRNELDATVPVEQEGETTVPHDAGGDGPLPPDLRPDTTVPREVDARAAEGDEPEEPEQASTDEGDVDDREEPPVIAAAMELPLVAAAASVDLHNAPTSIAPIPGMSRPDPARVGGVRPSNAKPSHETAAVGAQPKKKRRRVVVLAAVFFGLLIVAGSFGYAITRKSPIQSSAQAGSSSPSPDLSASMDPSAAPSVDASGSSAAPAGSGGGGAAPGGTTTTTKPGSGSGSGAGSGSGGGTPAGGGGGGGGATPTPAPFKVTGATIIHVGGTLGCTSQGNGNFTCSWNIRFSANRAWQSGDGQTGFTWSTNASWCDNSSAWPSSQASGTTSFATGQTTYTATGFYVSPSKAGETDLHGFVYVSSTSTGAPIGNGGYQYAGGC